MIKISKDTLSNPAEETLSISKDTLSNSAEEKIQALARELAELVIQFKALEQKVNDNDKIFSTDSLGALTGTIKDLFSTNIEADVFNSDKHSFSSGLEAQYLTMQPGTIVYAHTEESYILVIWLNTETYIVITPDKYLWQINRDFTFSLPSGDTFLFSYIGTGASNTETTFSEALRIFNSGCTIKGALNFQYSGEIEFSEGIIVKRLLQVEGQSEFNGDIDINGNVTITGDIKAEKNAEIDGTLTVKGDIIQQGSSYETHAEKLYTKNNLIMTRDGSVSALTDNEVTGIQAKLYDGTNDGQLVFSKDGVARVGDIGDLQPLATREETPKNGAAAIWDSTSQKYVSKLIDNKPTKGSTNLVTSGGVYAETAGIFIAGDYVGKDQDFDKLLTTGFYRLGSLKDWKNAPPDTGGYGQLIVSHIGDTCYQQYSAYGTGVRVHYRSFNDSKSSVSNWKTIVETNEISNCGRYFTVSCSTDASAQKKEISISNYFLAAGDIIGVTFTNANTYGDSTASTKTYPQLYIKRDSRYYTLTICDSRGNSCGTGCWNAGDYIEFRVISSTKVCIINSDIRQSASGENGYTIYSNNKIIQWGVTPFVDYAEQNTITVTKVNTIDNYCLTLINNATDDSLNWGWELSAILSGKNIIWRGTSRIYGTPGTESYKSRVYWKVTGTV